MIEDSNILNDIHKLMQAKSPGSELLFLVRKGSVVYGTNDDNSDIDYAGVYIDKLENLLMNDIVSSISDKNNDITLYEISKFIELLLDNNPNVLEYIFTPSDHILYCNENFESILLNKDLYLTKKCMNKFGSYSRHQINKSKGQDKKQNWEKDRITRKDVLDFVYVIQNEKSIPWKKWNLTDSGVKKYDEKFFGLVKIPNARDMYSIYYDYNGECCFSERYTIEQRNLHKDIFIERGDEISLGYNGIVKVSDSSDSSESNSIRLSSIPKGQKSLGVIYYNKDGYSKHCREYKEYTEWVNNKNSRRWISVDDDNNKINAKNMMHCYRLVTIAKEIAEGKGLIIKRVDDRDKLLDIKYGKYTLDKILSDIEPVYLELGNLYDKSNLPDSIDEDLMMCKVVEIRKKIYKIC